MRRSGDKVVSGACPDACSGFLRHGPEGHTLRSPCGCGRALGALRGPLSCTFLCEGSVMNVLRLMRAIQEPGTVAAGLARTRVKTRRRWQRPFKLVNLTSAITQHSWIVRGVSAPLRQALGVSNVAGLSIVIDVNLLFDCLFKRIYVYSASTSSAATCQLGRAPGRLRQDGEKDAMTVIMLTGCVAAWVNHDQDTFAVL